MKLMDEYCHVGNFKCRHASPIIYMKPYCDLKNRNRGIKKVFSDDLHCNNIGAPCSDLPACPITVCGSEYPTGGVSKNVARWFKAKIPRKISNDK